MTAKEYLRQLEKLDVIINQKVAECEELREKTKRISGVDYSKEKIHTGIATQASFAAIYEHIDELENEINAEIDAFVAQKHTIINQIQALRNTVYVKLLYKYYVKYQSLESIALDMDYSYDRTKHLHGCALQEFEKIFQISKVSTQ